MAESVTFPAMAQSAWLAARSIVSERAEIVADLDEARTAFLRRRCCRGLAPDACSKTFAAAVEVAQVARRFRRAHIPQNPPAPVRGYELLLALAKAITEACPDADQRLVWAACSDLQAEWR